MTRTLDEVIDGLPSSQQREIAAKAAQLMDEEMKQRDLNGNHGRTKHEHENGQNPSHRE